MPAFNKDLAAAVLLEAIFTTDARACQKFGITERTLRNYRKRLASDPVFAAFFTMKKKELFDRWADELISTVRAGARFLTAAAIEAEGLQKKNPEMVRAVAGAIKVCAEILITKRMIDARLMDPDRAPSELPESSYIS